MSILTRKPDSFKGKYTNFYFKREGKRKKKKKLLSMSISYIVNIISHALCFCRNSDPSKPGFLSENGNKIGSNDGIVENFDSGLSMEEVSADPSNDSTFSIELPRALTYDCGSPGCDPTRCCDLETSCVSKMDDTSISVVSSVKETSKNGSSESELHLRGRKEIEGCDWESLISDAADLLIFNYPQHEFSVEAKMQMFEMGDFSQQHVSVEDRSGQHQETSEMKEIDQPQDNLAADDANICAIGESSQIVDDEVGVSISVSAC